MDDTSLDIEKSGNVDNSLEVDKSGAQHPLLGRGLGRTAHSGGLGEAWILFTTFFKIGAFTLGGGYAMIPIIEAEVVQKRKWIDEKMFTDLIAVAQTCPGVFAANISIFIGYKLRKTKGALCTCFGACLPSFLIILLIAMFFHQFMDIPWIAAMFRGIRPAVVALIAVPTFNMARRTGINWRNAWIPIVSALLIWLCGVNPIWIIIVAGLGGYIYGWFQKSNI